jgi:hypothetical protein
VPSRAVFGVRAESAAIRYTPAQGTVLLLAEVLPVAGAGATCSTRPTGYLARFRSFTAATIAARSMPRRVVRAPSSVVPATSYTGTPNGFSATVTFSVVHPP